MNFTLSGAAEHFGAGTTVACYPGSRPPTQGGSPPGNPITSAVVQASGLLTFSGLNPSVDYIAYAGSPDRYMRFFTGSTPARPGTGHIFAGESVAFPDRGTLDVVGGGLSLTDDAANDRTVLDSSLIVAKELGSVHIYDKADGADASFDPSGIAGGTFFIYDAAAPGFRLKIDWTDGAAGPSGRQFWRAFGGQFANGDVAPNNQGGTFDCFYSGIYHYNVQPGEAGSFISSITQVDGAGNVWAGHWVVDAHGAGAATGLDITVSKANTHTGEAVGIKLGSGAAGAYSPAETAIRIGGTSLLGFVTGIEMWSHTIKNARSVDFGTVAGDCVIEPRYTAPPNARYPTATVDDLHITGRGATKQVTITSRLKADEGVHADAASGVGAFVCTMAGATTAPFLIRGNGQHEYGDGTAARDVILGRLAADVWGSTTDTLVGGSLRTSHVAAATPTGGSSGDIKVGNGKIWVNDAGTWKSAAIA